MRLAPLATLIAPDVPKVGSAAVVAASSTPRELMVAVAKAIGAGQVETAGAHHGQRGGPAEIAGVGRRGAVAADGQRAGVLRLRAPIRPPRARPESDPVFSVPVSAASMSRVASWRAVELVNCSAPRRCGPCR